jgi:hypothetical protein
MPRYPALPESLKADLAAIEPSQGGGLDYYPCCAVLRAGRAMERVFMAAEAPYIHCWGVYPEEDRGKFSVSIQDVVSVTDSPSRLPAKFANQLYIAGESGMGYHIFTVVFTDGTKEAYVTGNAVDFIDYPEGKEPKNVAAVLPGVGRDHNPHPAPKYHWCLYSDGEVPVHMRQMQFGRPRFRTSLARLLRRLFRRGF